MKQNRLFLKTPTFSLTERLPRFDGGVIRLQMSPSEKGSRNQNKKGK